MIFGTLILLSILTLVLYYFFGFRGKWHKPPPGPWGLPFIGNLLQMNKIQHISFIKWAKEYGSFYKLTFPGTKMVVVSDYKLVRQMFSESIFSGRMDFSLLDLALDGNVHGIINTEGDQWEELRRFTLRQLRDFGFGKKSMEDGIMIEVQELIDGLKTDEGKSIANVKDRFSLSVVNSLWNITTGTRYKQDDPKLLNLTRRANETFTEMLESGGTVLLAPIIAKWFPKLTGYSKIKNFLQEFSAMFTETIEEHKSTYSDAFQRDFVDIFLKEIRNTTNEKSAFNGKFGEKNLRGVIADLYFAGTDTTSVTLSWLILYMTKFPDIQRKFQQEIESATGNTRQCSLSDRPEMPYTEALFAETLRYSSIVPTGVQHRTIADTEFKGYFIPKGTLITPNLQYIHFDPLVWGDPENFRPERFLDKEGKNFKKHEALLAFSTGRRQCLGESLARDSLFLFATNLFQRFNLEFDKNGPDHGFEAENLFVLAPKAFNIIFKDRLQ